MLWYVNCYRFRAPRYRSIKMHDQLSSNKSEQYVVFYSQQVDARKHQESSSTFVWCTWHIRRGESEYLYQNPTKKHTCLSAANVISTNLSEALWHLRPTDYTTVLALWPTGRKTGQEAIKKSIGWCSEQNSRSKRPLSLQMPISCLPRTPFHSSKSRPSLSLKSLKMRGLSLESTCYRMFCRSR